MASADSILKVAVFVGLFFAVFATIITGTMLEDAFEGKGGTAGLAADAGGGVLGIHVALAGLVGQLMLLHVVMHHKMLVFHLNHSLGRANKK